MPHWFLRLAIMGTLFCGPCAGDIQIQDLEPAREIYESPEGRNFVVIRRFRRGSEPYCVVVDAERLSTQSLAQSEMESWKERRPGSIAKTPYAKALATHHGPPYLLENDGLTRADKTNPVHGWFLTVDMCQSKRPFEKAFFERVAALKTGDTLVPIALCMTGRWMREHPEEFAWILANQSLAVTWVNHSWTHPYDPKLPIAKNFLLQEGIDWDAEVLQTEAHLLARGLTPSIFFRCPGLVSNQALVERLTQKFGLIVLGADAWLAQGEIAKPGSIILLHGNGNEYDGIVKFEQILRKEPARPPLRPLVEALVPPR